MNKLPLYQEQENLGRFPSWLHRKLPKGNTLFQTHTILEKYRLNTVCEEAKCPNRSECYSKKTATFLALGKECTRSCGFCAIDFSKTPKAPEKDEPERIAASVKELGLKHVVVTMVARDDLPDGGALAFSAILREIHKENPQVTIEILTSDFGGNEEALLCVLQEKIDVFNHNLETVKRLSPRVRHKATYERSLHVLHFVKRQNRCAVKSGIMVGLGETEEEVQETLRDLHHIGCDIVTIGHYLQASARKLSVKAFITLDQFKAYEDFGHHLGIPKVFSGPFVRSSYHAGEVYGSTT